MEGNAVTLNFTVTSTSSFDFVLLTGGKIWGGCGFR
jgi:hypothetical protein